MHDYRCFDLSLPKTVLFQSICELLKRRVVQHVGNSILLRRINEVFRRVILLELLFDSSRKRIVDKQGEAGRGAITIVIFGMVSNFIGSLVPNWTVIFFMSFCVWTLWAVFFTSGVNDERTISREIHQPVVPSVISSS